jgi:hypothetical protein
MSGRTVALLMLAASLALSACGASSTKATAPSVTDTQPFSSPAYETAKSTPSTSAKMICAQEAQAEIASSIGISPTRVTTPTWNTAQHLYSCAYVYPKGKITLSVKEMSSAAETTAYYDGTIKVYGSVQPLIGLGQGARILKNNDVVVRKDYKVLLVDVTGIPTTFLPLMGRSDVATNIAATIMGCWSGT